ncbi:MAG: SAP domain-containing protein [bacterium]
MHFNEIKKIARNKGINTYNMRKNRNNTRNLTKRKNIDCYGTQRIEDWGEDACFMER